MSFIRLNVPGAPIAQKRPRFFRRGNFVGTYSEQETEAGRWIANALYGGEPIRPLNGPLSIVLQFHIARPKGHFGTGRNSGRVKPSAPFHPSKKPDIDNYVKFALDCLNGHAWVDDAQIVDLKAVKLYAREPRTIIHVQEVRV